MQELQKKLSELRGEFLKVYEKLGISDKVLKMVELEKEVAEPEIWRDVEAATRKNQELARVKEEVEPWELLRTQIEDLGELMEISDEDLKEEISGQIEAMEKEFLELKKALRF